MTQSHVRFLSDQTPQTLCQNHRNRRRSLTFVFLRFAFVCLWLFLQLKVTNKTSCHLWGWNKLYSRKVKNLLLVDVILVLLCVVYERIQLWFCFCVEGWSGSANNKLIRANPTKHMHVTIYHSKIKGKNIKKNHLLRSPQILMIIMHQNLFLFVFSHYCNREMFYCFFTLELFLFKTILNEGNTIHTTLLYTFYMISYVGSFFHYSNENKMICITVIRIWEDYYK